MTIEFSKQLKATPTPIPGVVLFDLPVHGDNRGWFKENGALGGSWGLGFSRNHHEAMDATSVK